MKDIFRDCHRAPQGKQWTQHLSTVPDSCWREMGVWGWQSWPKEAQYICWNHSPFRGLTIIFPVISYDSCLYYQNFKLCACRHIATGHWIVWLGEPTLSNQGFIDLGHNSRAEILRLRDQ